MRVDGPDQALIESITDDNWEVVSELAAQILADAGEHARTADELEVWITTSWAEHEAEFEALARATDARGQEAQRLEVSMATSGEVTPDLTPDADVSAEVESLMGLGEWLANRAVKAWKVAHPEAVAAANDQEDEEGFSPLAKITIATITAMLMFGGSATVMKTVMRTLAPMGYTVTKTWHTRHDDRVRESHRRIDRETRVLTQPFSNGVDHPSDRDGEPAETYNCRCSLSYDITRGGMSAALGGAMATKWEAVLTKTGPDTITGDGRAIDGKAVYWDEAEAPWPLKWDRDEGDHSAAIIGQIDEVWYDGDTLRGRGTLHDDSADPETLTLVARAKELIEGSPVLGVSVELDSETVEVRVKEDVWRQMEEEYQRLNVEGDVPLPAEPGVTDGRVTTDVMSFDDALRVVTQARFRGAALVDTAAFNDAKVLLASLHLAAAAGESPFQNPHFGANGDEDPRLVWQKPQRPEETSGWGCPLTVTDDGRVYGHIALKFRCHGAFTACVLPPDSGDDFSRFLSGEAERGTPTGPIILDTTHGVNPDGSLKAHDHLADTGLAVADVTVGRDSHGTWCAGRLRPGVTERQVAELRGSALSGEWHNIGGRLRLVGILAVNAPGYLIERRSLAASFTLGAFCCDGEDPATTRMRDLERELLDAWIAQVE